MHKPPSGDVDPPINAIAVELQASATPQPAIPVLHYGRPMPATPRKRLRLNEQNKLGVIALSFATVASGLVGWFLCEPESACFFIIIAIPCMVAAFALSSTAIFSRDGLTHAAWLALILTIASVIGLLGWFRH